MMDLVLKSQVLGLFNDGFGLKEVLVHWIVFISSVNHVVMLMDQTFPRSGGLQFQTQSLSKRIINIRHIVY